MSSEEEVYDVEAIVKHRIVKGRKQYFIKWLGYPSSENTWEDEENILSEELKKAYEESLKVPKAPKVNSKFEMQPTNEWGLIIDKVTSVSKNSQNQIEVEYVTYDGKKGVCLNKEIHIKAPVKLLQFYEQNLNFMD